MKNENVFIMEQPELGKRIQELRKSKGFTQEELVEMCNINVRTIQRIEAGEVSPRSFTIKTILEALGVDSSVFFKTSVHEENEYMFVQDDVKKLSWSWIAGIFFSVFIAVTLFFEFTVVFDYEFSYDEILVRSLLGVFSLGSLFFVLRGYHTLGTRTHNKALVYASIVYFVMELVSIIMTIILTVYDFDHDVAEITSGVLLILLLGAGEILMGVGIMKVTQIHASYAKALGVTKIIYGVTLMTIILAPIAVLVAIPILIAEIVFLFQVTQKAEKSVHS
jgi:transcriptional regulator with XRE-family HTH domain